ncbi:hypothetical protein [Paenibacillus sp. YYML68]|uniref:hypothetical protein n=1 Tax=Paenibacillus sp. YYML68 TaxID=2909250 RepID=UPI0024930159|nr:hypothetical protein [Paenibacillus sp. YYML68]
MKLEWKQFLNQPQFWGIFLLSELVFIFVGFRVAEQWQDIPSMIFFVMAVNLLYLLYGAEQARLEMKHYIAEQIHSLPRGYRYYVMKLGYWLSHVLLFYLISVVSIIMYFTSQQVEMNGVVLTMIWTYTFCNWFVPFLISVVIGYSLYSIFPHMSTYLVIVFVWILLGPYNPFVELLPSDLSPYLAVADTNFQLTHYIYVSEHMIVNTGSYWQRIVVVMAAFTIFLASVGLLRRLHQVRILIPTLLAGIVLIAYTAPTPRISDQPGSLQLEPDPYNGNRYSIEAYSMDLHHAEVDHKLSYSLDIQMIANDEHVSFALWDSIHIASLEWNGEKLAFHRQGNWVHVRLPSGQAGAGVLHLEAHTSEYPDVNPTSLLLLSTVPWYPMHPDEAIDPMGNAKKEKYDITLHHTGHNHVKSNLTQREDHVFTGEAYGPTILKGYFNQTNNLLYLVQYDKNDIRNKMNQIRGVYQEMGISSPTRLYFVSSATTYSANPDESFTTPLPIPLEQTVKHYLSKR